MPTARRPAKAAVKKSAPARRGPAKATRPAAKSKGLSVKTFKGLNKKRMESKASKNFGKRMNIAQGDTIPVQFLEVVDDFTEFEQHGWQEGGRWMYVPCVGDGCPLCADEDSKISKTSYRFCANVYNLKEKKVQILEGPKDLAGRIYYRYSRKPTAFLKRTFEITKFPTSPVTYDVAVGDDPVVKTTGLKTHDHDDYLEEEAKRYYGDEIPTADALDADDDLDEDEDALEDDEDDEDLDDDDLEEEDDEDEEEDDEDEEDEDDLDDEDDEDEEDEDDEEEDEEDDDDEEEDDEDEDEPPARRPSKAAARRPSSRKATPARKAAPARKKTAAARRR